MPKLCRVVEHTVEEDLRASAVPATSNYWSNGHPSACPAPPRSGAADSGSVRAPLSTASYGAGPVIPPPPRETGSAAAGQPVSPAAEPPASTPAFPPAVGGAATDRSGHVWALVCSHCRLVQDTAVLCATAIRDASRTIERARGDQFTGPMLPCVDEAWNRLSSIEVPFRRVVDQLRVYKNFFLRLKSGRGDLRSVDAAVLEVSAGCVSDCQRRVGAIHAQWQRWKLPNDDANSPPSDGNLAACAAGMAFEILRFHNEFTSVLRAFGMTIQVRRYSSCEKLFQF